MQLLLNWQTKWKGDGNDYSYNTGMFKSYCTVGKTVLFPICSKLSIGSPFTAFHMCFFLYIINNLAFDNIALKELQ